MKKPKVKNRKQELRKKRLLSGSLIISSLMIFSSLGYLSYRVLQKPMFISPVYQEVKKVSGVKTVQISNFALQLQKQLDQDNLSYTDIKINGNTCLVILSDEGQVIFSTDKDISVQMASLQVIVSRLTMEGKRFSHLDLRYDKPVIIF